MSLSITQTEELLSLLLRTRENPPEDGAARDLREMIMDRTGRPLSLNERFLLVRSVGEECQQDEELLPLLERNPRPVCYDGFEPSGRMHIAQGIFRALNVNALTRAGCHFIFWVADIFAQINKKLDGDMEKIQNVGKYFVETWKAIGMDMSRVEFRLASEEINRRGPQYWSLVIDVARRNTTKRLVRCSQIMGRSESEELTGAQLMYPCMQCADIFFLEADICQLGMDQRRVNMLAREYCDDVHIQTKPVVVSHHMIPGLLEGQGKMSKSNPASAIFMDDTEEEVETKIRKAFCPSGVVENNPCLEYIRYIVIPHLGHFTVSGPSPRVYTRADDVEADFIASALHPADLKHALAAALNAILEPVRAHFRDDPAARALLDLVRSYRVTR